MSLALAEGLLGDLSESEEQAITAMKSSSERQVQSLAALALASSSAQSSHAEALAGDLDKRFPKIPECSLYTCLR